MAAKFYGPVGFADLRQVSPGVWDEEISERHYYGDLVTLSMRTSGSEFALDDLTIGNSISILADPYALNNFATIRYVEQAGVKWKVVQVDVRSPRLLLRLGGVYNGDSSGPSEDPSGPSWL